METLKEWYPSTQQLKDPASVEQAFRETLRQFYEMRTRVEDLHAKVNKPKVAGTKATQLPVNTASDTKILGLPVEPSDTTQLQDGTVLTYVAATRTFRFL
jgi:hypothetical protein